MLYLQNVALIKEPNGQSFMADSNLQRGFFTPQCHARDVPSPQLFKALAMTSVTAWYSALDCSLVDPV